MKTLPLHPEVTVEGRRACWPYILISGWYADGAPVEGAEDDGVSFFSAAQMLAHDLQPQPQRSEVPAVTG